MSSFFMRDWPLRQFAISTQRRTEAKDKNLLWYLALFGFLFAIADSVEPSVVGTLSLSLRSRTHKRSSGELMRPGKMAAPLAVAAVRLLSLL